LHLTIDRHRHCLGWLIDVDDDVGNRWLGRGASKAYSEQLGCKKSEAFHSLFPLLRS
jgi:hypothetical protein